MEEWTNDEIGVGAAIAKGNQVENGIWALLVIEANNTKIKKIIFKLLKNKKFHDLLINNKLIIESTQISPIRFIKIVIILALNLFLFW